MVWVVYGRFCGCFVAQSLVFLFSVCSGIVFVYVVVFCCWVFLAMMTFVFWVLFEVGCHPFFRRYLIGVFALFGVFR